MCSSRIISSGTFHLELLFLDGGRVEGPRGLEGEGLGLWGYCREGLLATDMGTQYLPFSGFLS